MTVTDIEPQRPAVAEPGSQATAVEQARAIAEVRAAIMVAQQCPRDMRLAWANMRESCSRTALAERAFYRVPNRGNGPSVHLARELARIWGNLEYGVRELHRDDDGQRSEVLTYAWDQQTNVRSSRSLIVPHARMVKNRATNVNERQPLVDLGDIYLNNQNAGARAVRETIFTVLPADFTAEAQELCRATIERGDGRPLQERITSMLAAFTSVNVNIGQIESKLGRKRGHWTAADVADLSITYSSIKRGELRADEEFPQERVTVAEIMAGPVAAVVVPATSPATVPVSDDEDLVDAPEGVGIPRDAS